MNADIDQSTSIEPEPPAVLSVDKALQIVELLMRRTEAQTARDIADQLGMNRTTVHRLLNALIYRGWIGKVPDSASYRLSLKFLALTDLAGQSRSVVQEIRPALEYLSELSRETVHLGTLDGYEVVHVDKVDSPERYGIASRIGSRGIPHLTGLGKALLAAETDEYVRRYLVHWRSGAANHSVEAEAILTEIQATRARGYSIDDEEDSVGVRCLGVAILGPDSSPLFAISITGPSPRFTMDRLDACVSDLTRIARNFSAQFGWSQPHTVEYPDQSPRSAPE